jgi:hypothetical protein
MLLVSQVTNTILLRKRRKEDSTFISSAYALALRGNFKHVLLCGFAWRVIFPADWPLSVSPEPVSAQPEIVRGSDVCNFETIVEVAAAVSAHSRPV